MFRGIDFHVHTPASACYEDHMSKELGRHTSAEDIVKAALAAGLSAIVITDHNTVRHIDAVREAARADGLTVFPGIELTARGGHILTIFESDTPSSWLQRLIAELGYDKRYEGDAFYGADLWMDEIFSRVQAMGGLSIAAHVDREPRGFVAGPDPRPVKSRIYHSPNLLGIEITDRRDKGRWNEGAQLGFPLPRACIQGSDAHAPEEIGRRPVYLHVERWDLEAIRLAFEEFSDRIRFPDEL